MTTPGRLPSVGAPGRRSALLVMAVAFALTPACGDDSGHDPAEDAPVPSAGHQKMVALLADIAARTSHENAYLGEAAALQARRRHADLPPDAPVEQRWRRNLQVARQEMRVGNEERAIEHLLQAHELLDRVRNRVPERKVHNSVFRLGTAYLRLGEAQNCCQRNTPESCILPIRGGGIHTRPEASRKAIEYFTQLLETVEVTSAFHLKAKWLLNIAYMTVDAWPGEVPARYLIPPRVFESDEDFPRFPNVAERRGLATFNLSGGAVIDDLDGDGHLDVLTSTFDTRGPMHLFLGDGKGGFVERTEAAGLGGLLGGLNMVHADYDNDGLLDVLVLRGAWLGLGGRHPNSLLHNEGGGKFTDVTFAAGLGEVFYPTQTASWGDYDLDGDLDLYVGNENGADVVGSFLGEESGGRLRAPCQLFRNEGDGTFVDVAADAGVENFRFAKAVIWGDYDNDRYPDLYVSNLGTENRLYHNEGDGTFVDVASELGVTEPMESFPTWFWDFDNDGNLDLYVAPYRGAVDALAHVAASYLGLGDTGLNPPCLYRGDGRGGFRNVAAEQNVDRLSMAMGANFGDLDGDGFLDFYLGTGYPDYEGLTPNVMYRNRGGTGFSDVTTAGGFGHLQKGHAVVFADLDHDGDQDVFEQMGGVLLADEFADALYENPGFGNHWIAVTLLGVQSNRSAIGARIRVVVREDERSRSIYKHVNTGGTFGANPLRQTIGLGRAARIERLEVYWPVTDRTQVFEEVPMDGFLDVVEGEDRFSMRNLHRTGGG